MAVLSVAGGFVALALWLVADEPSLVGLVLTALLFMNALVRAELARRG